MKTVIMTNEAYDKAPAGNCIARHGDVLLFKPFSNIKLGAITETGDTKVLALGSDGDNPHTLRGEYAIHDNDSKIAYTSLPGKLISLPHDGAELTHVKHGNWTFPARPFFVVIQHEGDELGEIRKVRD